MGEQYGIAPGGFRLSGDVRVEPVQLQVRDLERSVTDATRTDTEAALAPHGHDHALVTLRTRKTCRERSGGGLIAAVTERAWRGAGVPAIGKVAQ